MSEPWDRFVAVVVGGKIRPSESHRFNFLVSTLEGKRIEVCMRAEVADRTLDQNAYLHVLAKAIAATSGYTLKEVKRRATLEALGPDAGVETYDIEGTLFREVRGTSSLPKDECSQVVEVLIRQAKFLEIPLPDKERIEAIP